MGDKLLPYANPVVPIDLGKWGMGEWCSTCPGFMRSSASIYWQSSMYSTTVDVMAANAEPHLTSSKIIFNSWSSIPLILLGVVPAKAQCVLTAWMGRGYYYDWENTFSGRTITTYPSGWRKVEAQASFGVMYGEWVVPGDAVLDAGDQVVCCYGKRSTGLLYGFCRVCG